jgi:hypothetical protein
VHLLHGVAVLFAVRGAALAPHRRGARARAHGFSAAER